MNEASTIDIEQQGEAPQSDAPAHSLEPRAQAPEAAPAWASQLPGAIAAGVAQGIAGQIQSQPHVADESFLYDNKALYERMRAESDQRIAQQQRQWEQTMRAPLAEQAVTAAAGELSKEAKEFVRKQLAGLGATSIAAVLNDPNQIELLQNAAYGVHARTAPKGTTAPRAEGVSNPGSSTDGLSGNDEREAVRYQNMMKKFDATFSLEDARKALRSVR